VKTSLLGPPPPLKWAGGKRWFVRRYRDALLKVPCRRIVEPFAGGLSLSFEIASHKNIPVLASDINPHLINFYKSLQLKEFEPIDLEVSKEFYTAIRSEFNQLITIGADSSLRGAQLFWALNRLGFNGLCRFNKAGFFNTPYGSGYRKSLQLPWDKYSVLLKNWTFQVGSFETLEIQKKDFLFCDPPYDHGWQGYYESSFSFEQQVLLARWVQSQSVPAVLMNHATPRILELYKSLGFNIHIISAPRRISARSDCRENTEEVLAMHRLSWQDLFKSV